MKICGLETGILSSLLAQAGLTAGVAYYNGRRKAGRDYAVLCLLRIVDENKPWAAK